MSPVPRHDRYVAAPLRRSEPSPPRPARYKESEMNVRPLACADNQPTRRTQAADAMAERSVFTHMRASRRKRIVTPTPEFAPDLADILSSRDARRALRRLQSLVAALGDVGQDAEVLAVLDGEKGLVATLRLVRDSLERFSNEQDYDWRTRQLAANALHSLGSCVFELEDIRTTAAARVAGAFDESFIGHSATTRLRAAAESYRSTGVADLGGNSSTA